MAQVAVIGISRVTRPQLAANIAAARAERGYTQEQVARALDVAYKTVQDWEARSDNKGSEPGGWNLVALSELLGRHPLWFYTNTEQALAA